MPPLEAFPGTGLYVIYYSGQAEFYADIVARAEDSGLGAAVYVGKAVGPGARSRLVDFDQPETRQPLLYGRLREHAESIGAASNLRLEDFKCRYVVLDEVFIPLGETLLIRRLRPVWNVAVKGFGLHDPGSGRTPRRSDWDTLHPGREVGWTAELRPGGELDSIVERIRSIGSGG